MGKFETLLYRKELADASGCQPAVNKANREYYKYLSMGYGFHKIMRQIEALSQPKEEK